MKRSEIVKSLLEEGFTETTLLNFSDKQLYSLAERILGEADIMISKKDPQVNQKIEDAKKQNKSIETYEEELKGGQKKLDKNRNGKIDAEDFKILKKGKKSSNKEIKEWVKQVANENFHNFTSKNEIMEMIDLKLREDVGSKVKTGHNGIPEFMTYDEISNTENAEPLTKPAPTKPKTSPTIKPKTPYQPGPGKNPKPKAQKRN